MRLYSRFLSVLAITFLIFSCNKELSYEGGTGPIEPPPVDTIYNWGFSDSGSAATDAKSGFTDTAYILTENNIENFFYEGSSSDHNRGIVFQVAGQPLAVGSYSGDQLAFGYFEGSSLIYTNIGADSDFTLVVSHLTQDSISATFTGHVRNEAGSLIQLNGGYLNSRIGVAVGNTDSVGNLICSSIEVNGDLKPGIAPDFNNYIDMQVHVTKPGNYNFETQVLNGLFFSGEQNFTDTGTFGVRLSAYGTPEEAGSFDFGIQFGNSTCTFNITVEGGTEAVVDGAPGTLARQIREQNGAATGEMKYYQLLGLIAEIQSQEDPFRKVYYENNLISKIELLTGDGAGGFTVTETRQYSYTPEGYVSGITRIDENGAFIDSVASYSYLPASDLPASRTYFSNGVRQYQLYYTYTGGNLTKIEKTNADYTSIAETSTFAFDPGLGNGFSSLHTQMYFLDMATFFEDGNYPEVLYFSTNLPVTRTSGTTTTQISVVVNPSLRPISITYNGTLWYRYEYN
jgi:hypothetical protein